MSLKVVLRPDESFVINGCVLRNGSRRSAFVLENQARLLRERDFPNLDYVENTKRDLYLAVVQCYVLNTSADASETTDVINALSYEARKCSSVEARADYFKIAENLIQGRQYKAVALARKTLIENIGQGASLNA